ARHIGSKLSDLSVFNLRPLAMGARQNRNPAVKAGTDNLRFFPTNDIGNTLIMPNEAGHDTGGAPMGNAYLLNAGFDISHRCGTSDIRNRFAPLERDDSAAAPHS